MTEQNTQSHVDAIEVVEGDSPEITEEAVVVIDPFADDDSEATAYVKLDTRREDAVSHARELLGDEADSATPEEAILALRGESHEFYRTMKSSPRQTRKFKRDFKATQPQNAKASARVAKATELEENLKSARSLLSDVRKSTDADSAKEALEAVKALADEMLGKLG